MTPRRAVLVAALAAPGIARAQQERPLRIVVPYPPGGGADLLARSIGAWVGSTQGRTVVIENRPGAAGTIGTAYLTRQPPDGETVLQADPAPATIQPLANRLPYTTDDLAPVVRLVTNVVVIGASPASGITSVASLVERAKARAGGLSYATSGQLSHLHLAMEAFAATAGIEVVHVPFQGTAPGVTAALAGQVDLVSIPPGALSMGSADLRLVPIAVMAAQRAPELPDVPTLRESGYDVIFDGWRGMFAPRGTPNAAMAIWVRAAFEAPRDPAFAHRLVTLAERSSPMGPEEFGRFWAADIAATRALLPRLPRG